MGRGVELETHIENLLGCSLTLDALLAARHAIIFEGILLFRD
jgi:hypothetical protein